MSDDKDDAPPPPEHGAKKRGGSGDAKVTLQGYEAMAQWYLAPGSPRTMRQMKADTGFSYETCVKAINFGWPERGWPSLKERAKIADRRAEEQAASASPDGHLNIVDVKRFMEMRRANLDVMRVVRGLALRFAQRINQAIETATAVRYVKQTQVVEEMSNGRVTGRRVAQVDVQAPPDLVKLADAAKSVASMVAIAGAAERQWIRSSAPEGEDPTVGLSDLTDEQIDYMIQNNGALPPGVTADQVRPR